MAATTHKDRHRAAAHTRAEERKKERETDRQTDSIHRMREPFDRSDLFVVVLRAIHTPSINAHASALTHAHTHIHLDIFIRI